MRGNYTKYFLQITAWRCIAGFGIMLAMRKTYDMLFFPVFLADMQFGAPFSDNAVLRRDMQSK